MKNKIFHYYVEGETEVKFVSTLKTDFQSIVAGKIEKFNAVTSKLNYNRIMKLKKGTTVVIVIDTDEHDTRLLKENIQFLENSDIISSVICVTQVENLEDELVRSCSIRQVKELTKSRSNREFKKDMINLGNFGQRLVAVDFDFVSAGLRSPQETFHV